MSAHAFDECCGAKYSTADFDVGYLTDDFDGDGMPELTVDAVFGLSGPYVLKYDDDSGRVKLYNSSYTSEFMYFSMLGTGRLYFCNGGLSGGEYWEYDPLDENGEVDEETMVYFAKLFHDHDPATYEVHVSGIGTMTVSKEEWDEITKGFFAAIEQSPEPMTYGDIFGTDYDGLHPASEDVKTTCSVYCALLEVIEADEFIILDADGDDNPELHLMMAVTIPSFIWVLRGIGCILDISGGTTIRKGVKKAVWIQRILLSTGGMIQPI